MAKEFSTTPSDLLRLEDDYAHFCLNEAAYLWGAHVEQTMHQAVEKVGEKAKKTQRERAASTAMKMLLYSAQPDDEVEEDEDRPEARPAPGAFRDPRELLNK